jgi:hypothetical protein
MLTLTDTDGRLYKSYLTGLSMAGSGSCVALGAAIEGICG